MKKGGELASLAKSILEGVETLRPLDAAVAIHEERAGGILRDNILLSLRCKVLPELRSAGDLPIFVGIQGGTNVGKSTVFNALAGQLISPAVVQASATKHPLVFVHESWRDRLLTSDTFPGLVCRELEDSKELLVNPDRTELIYFHFHSDGSLSQLALIDSPDFDSALESNLTVARYVTVLSDVTVYVTTAQKYKDRELVLHLKLLRDLKAMIILVFNMLDQEIVYNTLLEDLRSSVNLPESDVFAIRLPHSSSTHPEDELKDLLAKPVLERLYGCKRDHVKPLLVERTMRRTLDQVFQLTQLFSVEVKLKVRFTTYIDEELQKTVDRYVKSFSLALPEETLAVRKVLRQTELWPFLKLSADVEKSSTPLQTVGLALRRFTNMLHQLFLRLSNEDEGSIEDTLPAVANYARTRNQTDSEQVSLQALSLWHSLESFFRDHDKTSPLAHEALADFFNPDGARAFSKRVREEFEREVESRRSESGEDIVERVNAWIERHTLKRRLFTGGSLVFKFAAGYLLAYAIPPNGPLEALNWVYFVVGYLLAAYFTALTVSVTLRRKKPFRRARIEGFREILKRTLTQPLSRLLEEILCEKELGSVATAAKSLQEELGHDGDLVALETGKDSK